MEEWRDTGAAQGGVTRQAACESQSANAEVGLTKLFEVTGHRKDTEEDQSSLTQVQRRVVAWTASTETLFCVSASSNLDQNMDEEREKRLEEISSFPSAVSEPRWALHMCDKKCRAKGFKFFYEITSIVTEGGGEAHTIVLSRNCYNERRSKQGEVKVSGARLEGADSSN